MINCGVDFKVDPSDQLSAHTCSLTCSAMDDDGTIPPVSLVNPLDTARFLSNSSHAGRGLSELPLFLESIDHWYEVDTEKRALVWLDSKGEETDSYTRGELHREIDRIAGMLLASGVQPGDRAILFYPPSLDFVISLMACFRARIIGVPVFPPVPGQPKKLDVVKTIARASGATYAFTNATYFANREKHLTPDLLTKWPDLQWIITSQDGRAGETDTSTFPPAATATDTAFLQFTSGSTSDPKGVVVNHGCLANNLCCLAVLYEQSPEGCMVSWTPQYHDLGLIGGNFSPMWAGMCTVFMSPTSFVRNPPLWLKMMSKYGATGSMSPNFGYKLALKKWKLLPKEKQGPLDLSRLKYMINAAEPVEASTLRDFEGYLTPYAGFNGKAMGPSYGLAENTVLVSGTPLNQVRGGVLLWLHYVCVCVCVCGENGGLQKGCSSATLGALCYVR